MNELTEKYLVVEKKMQEDYANIDIGRKKKMIYAVFRMTNAYKQLQKTI